MKSVGPEGQTCPFLSSNEPQNSPLIFCDSGLQLVFGQKISWTSVKTLVMESTSVKTLVMEPVGFEGILTYFWPKFSRTSIMTLVMESVGPAGQTGPFYRLNEPKADKTRF
ncbi:hypothetical protein H5410_035144 [Solanum commersonii]|uniref:Uncharacterized protein n=1 Tax=Solanum commersonii TaxID=4109 RepID=A0A9J5Y2Y5_SOLCO|nr:hypothetical protein H5410_035144 [Solanum commersonii]